MKPLFITDFDGTINVNDVSFLLLNEMTGGVWHGIDQEFISGKIGSKEAYARITRYLTSDKMKWVRYIRKLENLDPHFKSFLSEVKRHGWDVMVVSDGFDIYINEIFTRNGIKNVDIYANRVSFREKRVKIDFPYSSDDCDKCGVCKRDILLIKKQEGYYPIIYIGDGYSDRCGAFYADWVFAKKRLSKIFISKKRPFSYLKDFNSIISWFSRRIKGLIFDLDGTLLDSYPAILKSLRETFFHFGICPPNDNTLKENIGIPLKEMLMGYFNDEDIAEEGKRIFREKYMKNYTYKTRLLYGARSIIVNFKKKGYKIGIISNKHELFVKLILKWKRIMRYVDIAMGENDNVPPKPDPFMIKEVLKSMDIRSSEAIMIGDTRVDVESARKVEVECAGVATGSDTPDVLYSIRPEHFLFRLKDFEQMMKVREKLWEY